MCYVNVSPEEVVKIKEAITELVRCKRRFTGQDVEQKAGFTKPYQRSAKVRELFNAHDPVFTAYACFPVQPNGPLLYFYAGSEVLRKADAILGEIRGSL